MSRDKLSCWMGNSKGVPSRSLVTCIVATITLVRKIDSVYYQEVVATIQVTVTEDTDGPTLLKCHYSWSASAAALVHATGHNNVCNQK